MKTFEDVAQFVQITCDGYGALFALDAAGNVWCFEWNEKKWEPLQKERKRKPRV